MTISITGGKEHLKRYYEKTMKEKGHKMRILLQNGRHIYNRLGRVNGIIMFTNDTHTMLCGA